MFPGTGRSWRAKNSSFTSSALAWRYGDDPDAHRCEVPCYGEGHSNDAPFGSGIRSLAHLEEAVKERCRGFGGGCDVIELPHLSVEGRHAGGVDDAAPVSVRVRLVLRHLADGEADHVKSPCNVHLRETRSGRSAFRGGTWGRGSRFLLLLSAHLTLMTRWKSSRLWGASFLKL